jgi:hypothetical protein
VSMADHDSDQMPLVCPSRYCRAYTRSQRSVNAEAWRGVGEREGGEPWWGRRCF